jgi:hypothetical protein
MVQDAVKPSEDTLNNTLRKLFNQYTFHESSSAGGGYGWRTVTTYSTNLHLTPEEKGKVGKYVEGNISTQIKNFLNRLDQIGIQRSNVTLT